MFLSLQQYWRFQSSAYVGYQLFYQEQPFGLWREDYRHAQLAHLTAMINRDPKSEPPELSEFMPFFNCDSEQKTEDDGVAAYLAKR